MQHSLGLDQYGRGSRYRNHFVTCEDCDNFATCMALVGAGLMERHGPHSLYGGRTSYCFSVTEAGDNYVRAHSPFPPKLSRGQRRYLEWLRVSDVYNVTFGEWLKMQHRATAAQKGPHE